MEQNTEGRLNVYIAFLGAPPPPMKSATPPWKVPPPLAALWCMAMVAAKYIGLWGQISSSFLVEQPNCRLDSCENFFDTDIRWIQNVVGFCVLDSWDETVREVPGFHLFSSVFKGRYAPQQQSYEKRHGKHHLKTHGKHQLCFSL